MTIISPAGIIVDSNGNPTNRMRAWIDLVSQITDVEFPVTIAQGGTSAENPSDARDNLGLTIGTNVSDIIDVQDDAVSISSPASTLNFTGSGVVVTEGPAGQANIDIVGGGGGVTTFDALTDTPASKVTFAFDFVRVNAGETALEYHAIVPADIGAQPEDDGLTSISGLTTAADTMIYTTALDVYAITSLTLFGRSLIDDADAGTARATLDVDPAGTDNSTDVTLAGTPNYITIVGQVITRALINLASHVTGVLGLSNGGTGDAAVTAANIGHLKAMDQDVGTLSNVDFGAIRASGTVNCDNGNLVVGDFSGAATVFIRSGSSTDGKIIFDEVSGGSGSEWELINEGVSGDFSIQGDVVADVFRVTRSSGDIDLASDLSVSGTASIITSGSGSPEGVVTAPIGSTYTRTDGGAGTTFYVKESGTGNTGWVAYS